MAWAFRLNEELKVSLSGVFLTLTYEVPPVSFNGLPTLQKSDFQKFMKRVRKKYPNEPIKYYACGEYGSTTLRPHYHAIIFNLPTACQSNSEILSKIWGHGHLHIGAVSMSSIVYTTKYIMKGLYEPLHELDDREPERSMMSKNLGISHLKPTIKHEEIHIKATKKRKAHTRTIKKYAIGNTQIVRHYKEKFINHVTLPGGAITSLPRYFQDKLFSKADKKIFHEAAEQARDADFKKFFDDCFKKEVLYKKNLIRKTEKQEKLKRQKL